MSKKLIKKYVVETWVRLQDVFDDKEKAEKSVKNKKNCDVYKDTKLITLVEEK